MPPSSPAYTPIIFTSWDVHSDSGGYTGTVRTLTNCTLWLIIDTAQPSLTPRYVRKYGVTRQCGFFLHWNNPTFIHEDGPGGFTVHTWDIFHARPIPNIWTAAITADHFGKGTSATPPMLVVGRP